MKLKQTLKLPYIIKFHGCSRANIGRIIRTLLDQNISVKIYKINNEDTNMLGHAASFFERKNILDV